MIKDLLSHIRSLLCTESSKYRYEGELSCINFIKFREVLDDLLVVTGERSEYKYTLPREYAKLLLPGLIQGYKKEEPVEEVSPFHVAGCSWLNHCHPKNPRQKMDELNNPADKNKIAHYLKIGDLPLYIAKEGKNRVELFKRNNRRINATVRKGVISDDIKIGRNRRNPTWIVQYKDEYSGRQEIAPILYPNISLPIYNGCGIKLTLKSLNIESALIETSIEDWRLRLINSYALA